MSNNREYVLIVKFSWKHGKESKSRIKRFPRLDLVAARELEELIKKECERIGEKWLPTRTMDLGRHGSLTLPGLFNRFVPLKVFCKRDSQHLATTAQLARFR